MDEPPPLKKMKSELKLLNPKTWIPRKRKEERGESSDVKPTQKLLHMIPKPNPTKLRINLWTTTNPRTRE
jgi:hypothetical protein